jgi:hypothetical protein
VLEGANQHRNTVVQQPIQGDTQIVDRFGKQAVLLPLATKMGKTRQVKKQNKQKHQNIKTNSKN